MHEVICRVAFADEAQAADLVAQISARITNATAAGIGTPGVRTSYFRQENLDTETLVTMGFVDEFGIVRSGEYIAPNPYPVWVAPTGAENSYPILRLDGQPTRVIHNGQEWQNTAETVNTWIPGEFGWTLVSGL